MSSKFFNNQDETDCGKSLFDRFRAVFNSNVAPREFLAVSGYFRSSGYFKVREAMRESVEAIRILVGIEADRLAALHQPGLLNFDGDAQARAQFFDAQARDVLEARYAEDVERGMLQMVDDMRAGRLEMRLYPHRNLHAKFYIFLPADFNTANHGAVIMGSSNLTDSGLGIGPSPSYELNVEIRDHDDVDYCRGEFERLWAEGVTLTAEEMGRLMERTHLGAAPTPYEIYMKVLIELFGAEVEENLNLVIPQGFKTLQYQTDAVKQGYQMLMRHNGFMLADVVGLGKTVVAAMIAKKFEMENGRDGTQTLVVTPPTVRYAWEETFRRFGMRGIVHYVTIGSLEKVLGATDNYSGPESYNLVIVDEAHLFRNSTSDRYGKLQDICKKECTRRGRLNRTRKAVMLLSATPLNNRPDDLLNQLLLFENSAANTLDGIDDLETYFTPVRAKYKAALLDARDGQLDDQALAEAVDKLYGPVRRDVLSQLTIRRTRSNIVNDKVYAADLRAQGVEFPTVEPPVEMTYGMDKATKECFYYTLTRLTQQTIDDENPSNFDPSSLCFARYRALEFVNPDIAKRDFPGVSVRNLSHALAGIYRVLFVKRLESSFHAFRESLRRLLLSTEVTLKFYDEGKVYVARSLDLSRLLDELSSTDDIAEQLEQSDCRVYDVRDFDPTLGDMLRNDLRLLQQMKKRWDAVECDPKWDCLARGLEGDITAPERNPSGKVVIFSESKDTLQDLSRRFAEAGRTDVLMVTSDNAQHHAAAVRANFDANAVEQRDDIRILLASDALAEGVNLHRANVVVNYDTPWNATRLMQRLGRVNRIGSTAGHIYSYVFFPTREGEDAIGLAQRSVAKLQGFHSSLGEDNQVMSRQEIVHSYQMYDHPEHDEEDDRQELRRKVQDLFEGDRALYNRIKALPAKSRTWRSRTRRPDAPEGLERRQTVAYLSGGGKKKFFAATPGEAPRELSPAEALRILEAAPDEAAATPTDTSAHYAAVVAAMGQFGREEADERQARVAARQTNPTPTDKRRGTALKFLRGVKAAAGGATPLRHMAERLMETVEMGVSANITAALGRMARQMRGDTDAIAARLADIEDELRRLAQHLNLAAPTEETGPEEATPPASRAAHPEIIISETYVD